MMSHWNLIDVDVYSSACENEEEVENSFNEDITNLILIQLF